MKHFRKIGCPKIKSLLWFSPKNLTISHQWRIHQKQEEGERREGREKNRKTEEPKGKREERKGRGCFTESFWKMGD